MNKLLAVFLSVGLLSVAVMADSVRGAKGFGRINASATPILACKGPAAVYSVFLSTGALTDYAVLRDSGTANTTSARSVEIGHQTTGYVQVTFDPPLQFRNGVSFNTPATTSSALVTCETGVVTKGY